MIYRSEIDGLRAVAVLPVILFHAGFEFFSGGYIGVDVFFVISGYLITTILVEEIEHGKFSLLRFYERRARRILPALFFVMLCCLPFAWMWMLPGQMKDFSQSLAAVSLFISNILFWRQTGYFSLASEEKPLLHTWSLAVEEQYYLLFPVFLVLVWRFGRGRVFWSIILLFAISLALSEWGWRNKPTPNFYLAPTRIWELLAGSIAAFIASKSVVKKSDSLSMLGLGAIVISIFAYDESTPIPSLYALAPVLGAVFVILFAQNGTIAARLLCAKPLVGIGLISYSAYLWHQPVFAFARIRSINDPSSLLMASAACLSLILAVFSWKYVEQPFRNGKRTIVKKRSSVFAISALGSLAFLGFGLWGNAQQGISWRIDKQVLQILSEANSKASDKCLYSPVKPFPVPLAGCESLVSNDNGKVLLLGDSHSMSISSEVSNALNAANFSAFHASYSGCIPFVGFRRFDRGRDHKCSEFVESALVYAQDNNIDTLIFTARFPWYYFGNYYDNGEGGHEPGNDITLDVESVSSSFPDSRSRRNRVLSTLEERIVELSQNYKVVLVAPVPENGWDVITIAAKRAMFNGLNDTEVTSSYDRYLIRTLPIRELFGGLASELGNVKVAEIQNGFCSTRTRRCKAFTQGRSLYFDDDHLSLSGARIAAEIISSVVVDLHK